MKTTFHMFVQLGVFMVFIDIVYTAWHLGAGLEWEWVGTIGFLLAAGLSFMVAFYVRHLERHLGRQPNDDPAADPDVGDPEMGEFAPWSWWPLVFSASIALLFLGLSVKGGIWLAIIALLPVVVSVVGFVYEQYRGRWVR